jgi:hypothetical protein
MVGIDREGLIVIGVLFAGIILTMTAFAKSVGMM